MDNTVLDRDHFIQLTSDFFGHLFDYWKGREAGKLRCYRETLSIDFSLYKACYLTVFYPHWNWVIDMNPF